VGVENARLLQDREREIARLEALTNIAAASASTLDFQQMFERVATTLRPLLHFDGFLAAAYDAEHNAIISGIGWSLERDVQPVDHLALDQPSRLAQMVRQREPLLLRHTDPLHYQLQPQQFWERGALSWLGVPLLSRNNEPIGVLAIQSARPHAFGQRDLRFLNAVARQLALNVENAQLYLTARTSAVVAEQRADNLTLVHSISRLVNSSLDPQEVLGIAAEELVKLFGVDHCGIVVYNTPGWIGEIVAEFPPLGVRGQRVAFQNVDDFREDMQYIGQPIVIHDALQDIRTRPIHGLLHQHEVRAMLIVPLISRGRAVGAIGLNQRTEGRSFSPEELELCRTIAAQVAIALENARLFQLSVTRVEQEMEIARSIQANLFPTVLPTIPGADLAVRCIPARETGGDFYDVLPLEGGRYGLSVGDVSGKSLPAAMLMAVARSVVRSEALDHALPDDVMCQTNTLIAQDVPPDSYVALCYAVYDSQRRTVDLAIGGQLTPLLRHADGSVEFVDAVHDLPLGIAGDVRYTSTHIQLVPGDTLLLYTDGLVEAFSPKREIFGFDRLQQTFGACGDCPAVETVERLLGAVRDWQNGAPRSDDITAVVLRIT
jgi:phosphoserine phosphatase RsbU/P